MPVCSRSRAPEHAPEVLGTLSEHAVPGTFYVTGAESEESLETLCMLIVAGHEIGDHWYSHVRPVAASQEAIAGEVEQTDGLIRAARYGG